MKTPKALVIGASGFVGQYLYQGLPEKQRTGTYHKHEGPGLQKLDWTDSSQIEELLNGIQPEIIYVPASWTHVEACEQDPRRCLAINDGGMKSLCEAVDPEKTRIVYFSTDYVFNGEQGPYSEDDETGPVNVYGESKLSAERRVMEHSDRNLVIRTTVVYGWERRGKNSIQRLIQALRGGEEWRAPIDQWGSPTYVENLIEVTLDLVNQGKVGIYHVCGSDWISRYQFALLAAQVFDLPAELMKPVRTSELNQRARRPMKAGMKVNKALAATQYSLLPALEGLMRMKERENHCSWGNYER